jgi:tellurite resistance protein TerB
MMDWLKTSLDAARKGVVDEISRYRNRDFLDAIVAGCAMVAAADGTISASEKQKMFGFLRSSEELKVFGSSDIIASWDGIMQKFDFDVEIGSLQALAIIAKVRRNQRAAKLLVRVCCLIGAADGNFDDDEKHVVARICRELALDPKDFGITPAV